MMSVSLTIRDYENQNNKKHLTSQRHITSHHIQWWPGCEEKGASFTAEEMSTDLIFLDDTLDIPEKTRI